MKWAIAAAVGAVAFVVLLLIVLSINGQTERMEQYEVERRKRLAERLPFDKFPDPFD